MYDLPSKFAIQKINTFNQFNIFKKLMVENGGRKKNCAKFE
jgi:hypothetical protein